MMAQSKFSKKLSPPDTSLIDIIALKEADPVQAINRLRERLAEPRNKNKLDFQMRAYELLGDINADIEQFDLATRRYDQALSHTEKAERSKKRILFKQGNAYITFDLIQAKLAYSQCLAIAENKYQGKLCEEGVADILYQQDSLILALEQYQELEKYFSSKKYLSDEIRIQSKIASVFSKQNDLPKAQLNLQNAYSNANTTPIVSKKDKLAYENAKEDIIEQEGNRGNEIITRGQNIELKKESPVDQAVERLKLAEAYVKGNQPQLALNTLKIAERSIRELNAPKVKADINKKLSEVYASEGDLSNALSAMERYEDERQIVLDEKEKELNEQIAIVKGQQKIDLDEKDYINKSTRQSFEIDMLKVQKYIIGLLSLLLLIAAVSIYFILKNVKAKNRANNLLELKGLRAQMNPHFLFNALNTVNEYIVLQDERKANQFLSDFSGLMRKVLENSQKDLISLEDEIEVSQKYLELEHRRFEDKFDFVIDIDSDVPSGLMVPPLLFQPYLENAIWHGLRSKEGKGQLIFSIKRSTGFVEATIEDNGIGRNMSLALKTKNQKMNQSTGLKNTAKRMELINEVFNKSIRLEINDLDAAAQTGTSVSIKI